MGDVFLVVFNLVLGLALGMFLATGVCHERQRNKRRDAEDRLRDSRPPTRASSRANELDDVMYAIANVSLRYMSNTPKWTPLQYQMVITSYVHDAHRNGLPRRTTNQVPIYKDAL
jgi:hypothetical protein